MNQDLSQHHAGAMRARAAISTKLAFDRAGERVSRIQTLRSNSALVLRPTQAAGPEPLVRRADGVARVSLVAGAAGPLGGDDFALDICVGAGTTLLLNEISSTLLLPGARGGQSRMRIHITVQEEASFVWLAESVIAAQGCEHVHEVRVDLAPGARMLIRDELQLGRHKEQPGNLMQDLHIRCDGKTLFRQQLRLGPAAPGWRSPAVMGGHKCVGNVLVIDPQWREAPPAARVFAPDAALMPLEGPAVAISALATDAWALRQRLDQGIQLLGDPWSPTASVAPR